MYEKLVQLMATEDAIESLWACRNSKEKNWKEE